MNYLMIKSHHLLKRKIVFSLIFIKVHEIFKTEFPIFQSSLLLEIFIIKICEAFSLIVLRTLKQDCEIKTKEIY